MSFVWKRPEGRLMSPEDMMRVIIRVADELGMPDKRGACVIAGMTVKQEGDFWRPGNNADPCFAANPGAYQHDSMGDDGKSVGPYQQQTSDPPPASQWGWGGLYGDPEGTRKRMDPYESTKMFLTALKRVEYRAGNAREANDWAQHVQNSGVPDAYAKHWDAINQLYDSVTGAAPAPPPAPPATYGLPTGSDSGGYGGNGVRFPDWVYQLGNAFGVKPSTYPGHQESDRNEAGYAPNPNHLNRAIDWAGSVGDMTRFADYLATIPQFLEQVIWQNPNTGRSIEVAGGRHQPGYFAADLAGHRDHVHTRQSRPIPIPGGAPAPAPVQIRPSFTELDYYSKKSVGQGFNVRSRKPINFFIHTEEGDGSARSLADFCDGSNGVSYHYTVRDRIVCDVVDTDYYSWSVLNANVFSINLCFAGSFVAWSRDRWLQREPDIEIAAYLAVQDCRKYGIPTDVIAPPYHEAAGISDHKYVTQQLHIGDHTDVGNNFPWDVFARYVSKYATGTPSAPPTQGEGFLMALSDSEQREALDYLRWLAAPGTGEFRKKFPSRSGVHEPGEGLVDTLAGLLSNVDGNVDFLATDRRAQLRYPPARQRLQRVAAGGEPGRNPDDALLAQAILAEATAKPEPQVVNVTNAQPVVQAVDNARELEAAYAEIARLRDENSRLQAVAARQQTADVSTELAIVEAVPKTTGDLVKGVVDSNEGYVERLTTMDPKQLTALRGSLEALQPPAGSQP